MLNSNYHVAISTLELCEGSTSKFVSYDGKSESFRDHTILPVEKVETVNECFILDDDALIVSQHRPIFMPPTSKNLMGHIASGAFVRPFFTLFYA